MKTSLRHLFNYWLPPGVSGTFPVPNPLVDLAVKINASCVAMISGAEIDWDEVTLQNEEWAKLVIRREALIELTRLSEEMGWYAPDLAEYSTFNERLKQCEANISRVLLAQAKTETEPKST